MSQHTARMEMMAVLMLVFAGLLLCALLMSMQGCTGAQVTGEAGVESERVRVEVAGDNDGLCIRGEARKLPVGGFVCYSPDGRKLEVCAIIAGMHICIPMGDA